MTDNKIKMIREAIRKGGLECLGMEHWVQNNTDELKWFDELVAASQQSAQGGDAHPFACAVRSLQLPGDGFTLAFDPECVEHYQTNTYKGQRTHEVFPLYKAVPSAAKDVEDVKPLTSKQIEAGWKATFSTDNPYCPCNLKSFTKAVNWAERAIAAANAGKDKLKLTE